MQATDPDINVMELHLAEYSQLREEQRTRLNINSSMLNFILIIIGAEIAAYAQMIVSVNKTYFPPLILATPLLTAPIALFYYDNQLMVYRIGRYFSTELYPVIERTIGYNPFGWERFHQATSGQLALVALGRNLFFVLITIAPIIIFLLLKIGYRELDILVGQALPFHPIQAWRAISGRVERWESWLLITDFFLLVAVAITWAHSGWYFSGIKPISYIVPERKPRFFHHDSGYFCMIERHA